MKKVTIKNGKIQETEIQRYQVRMKQYEKHNWKVIKSFDDRKQALRFAIQSEMKARKSLDTMYDHWDLKDMLTGERYIVA